ncbi:RagB/SusD family nutrient uptake outer membrane protein [Pedobacter frigiditerrae]|uniref:RagB/SusD family nutrient uptake outer membrane protein n=1 Tax=Pedobacter frigiditerrae TaxID=2530452 RepID=A0A4R0N8F4_9SPHI|nr:RagB/SusD family nutrient uptake outer membrane protein [Pedobacter frigiditerrae]TCC94504.1 RagB/SusD family nutrient uptake outer membrane protein [Pedobacter frigiditerrae]
MKNFNNTIRNFVTILVIITIISTVSGCKQFLDTERQGVYTTENYPYPTGAGPYDQFLFGAYKDLRGYGVHVTGFFLATSVRSDDADKGSTAGDGGADANSMDTFPVLPSNGIVNGMWVEYLTLINKCNTALDQIENNKDIVATDAVKLQSSAEAKFIRGYAYFNMVRFFGRVPLIDKVLTVAQINIPQSTPAQIYALIESDLKFAAANLPISWDKKFIGRPTSGSANGILAKVYLTQQKWALAMSAANLVMTNGQYDLSTPYDKIFGEAGENSKESVFEIQATASATVQTDNGIQTTQFQGVRDGGVWNLGFGWNVPNTNLENAYEAGDPRKARTFLYRNTAATLASPNPYKTVYGEITATTWNNPIYNHKAYTNPSFRAAYGYNSGWWMNLRILRYADVVLMYAEAANEVGGAANTTASLAALNSVRARARNGNAAILPNVVTTDQTALRLAIQQERRIELAMEYDRFFDLVRWGIAQTALTAAGRPNYNPARDNVLPIPQTQIDLSKGVLTPNPNY